MNNLPLLNPSLFNLIYHFVVYHKRLYNALRGGLERLSNKKVGAGNQWGSNRSRLVREGRSPSGNASLAGVRSVFIKTEPDQFWIQNEMFVWIQNVRLDPKCLVGSKIKCLFGFKMKWFFGSKSDPFVGSGLSS